MKPNYRIFIKLLFLLLAIPCIESFKPFIQQAGNTAWRAPVYADTLKNLFNYNDAITADAGKKAYTQYCVTCHGSGGKGDGIAANALHPRPASLMASSVINESDGAIFWKITNGKSPMPTWGKILKPAQRWDIVCFIRLMQKKQSEQKSGSATGLGTEKHGSN